MDMMMMSQNYEYTALHTESSEIRSVGAYPVTSVTGPSLCEGVLEHVIPELQVQY